MTDRPDPPRRAVIRYASTRLIEILAMLALMSVAIYALIGLMPGDPIDLLRSADPRATAADIARLKAAYGLDQPLSARYLAWAGSALGGDLGYSRLFAQPVLTTILPRLANSLLLMGISFALAFALALALGIAAARRPGAPLDAIVNAVSFVGISIPSFWLALILILVFAVTLGWLPASGVAAVGDGGLGDRARHLVLPVATLTLASLGSYTRYVRVGDARGFGPAAHPHRPRQGGERGPRHPSPRAAHGARPAGHDPRPVVRQPRFGRARHRDHVRLSRDGKARLRRGDGERLQSGAGGAAVRRRDDDGGEPRRRPRLCLARPAGRLPVRLPLLLLGAIAVASAAGPWVGALLGTDPQSVDLFARMAGPSPTHPLGADELGRDILLRLLEGGRVSLAVGLAAALAAAALGTVIGLVAGYLGGWADRALMRLTDAVISLPLLPLLIVLAAVDLGKIGAPRGLLASDELSLLRIVALVSLVGWTTAARLVRGATLVARRQDFVRAARSLGASAPHILLRHVLPNVSGPLIVATALGVGDVILLELVLSFLGLGVQPPMASWGSMLTNAQEELATAPMLAVYPGAMIFATVISCNLLGDAVQRRLAPGLSPRA